MPQIVDPLPWKSKPMQEVMEVTQDIPTIQRRSFPGREHQVAGMPFIAERCPFSS